MFNNKKGRLTPTELFNKLAEQEQTEVHQSFWHKSVRITNFWQVYFTHRNQN